MFLWWFLWLWLNLLAEILKWNQNADTFQTKPNRSVNVSTTRHHHDHRNENIKSVVVGFVSFRKFLYAVGNGHYMHWFMDADFDLDVWLPVPCRPALFFVSSSYFRTLHTNQVIIISNYVSVAIKEKKNTNQQHKKRQKYIWPILFVRHLTVTMRSNLN